MAAVALICPGDTRHRAPIPEPGSSLSTAPDRLRLNRFLALGGLGSRRGVENLILEGQVTINGEVCLDLSRQVAPQDEVRVGRKRVEAREIITLAMHKPAGLVTTRDDELNRATIYKLLPGRYHHLRHVGRLDLESEGLLLLTNDGELAQRITAPSSGMTKEYLVTLDQAPGDGHLQQFLSGIYLPEGKAWAEEVIRVSPRRLVFVLGQGLKRQIRMMTAALGFRVKKLVRTRIGGLTLEELVLAPGKWVPLGPEQLQRLTSSPPPRKTLRKRAGRPSGGDKPASRRPAADGTGRRETSSRSKRSTGRPGTASPGGGSGRKGAARQRPGTPRRGGGNRSRRG